MTWAMSEDDEHHHDDCEGREGHRGRTKATEIRGDEGAQNVTQSISPPGHGCRMATGCRGAIAVTSRRHSWHSLPSCYRASLPRRDERTGPQPLAARPLHVKRGRAFGVPPTLRRHWSSNTTRLRARQPHQPKTPRVGTDAAPISSLCPCLLRSPNRKQTRTSSTEAEARDGPAAFRARGLKKFERPGLGQSHLIDPSVHAQIAPRHAPPPS